MNIAGLVYNNEESVSSTGVSNRGVMAPHMDPNGSSYMQVHHHSDFDGYPQGYFEPHQVPQQQYQPVQGMMGHPSQYHHPSAPYNLRQQHQQHPQHHPQHTQHHQHAQHQAHQHMQGQQHQQHAQQQQHQHHAIPVSHPHHVQHHHLQQQTQQAVPRRGTPVQAMPQAIQQPMPQAMPQVSRELMNNAPRTRSAMQRNPSNLSVKTQLPQNNMQYAYAQQPSLATPPLSNTQNSQPQRQQHQQHQQHQHVPQVSQQQQHQQQQQHRPQQIQIPTHQQRQAQQQRQQRQQQQHQSLPPTPVLATPTKQESSPAPRMSKPNPVVANAMMEGRNELAVEFKTDVDTLMKAIQARAPTVKTEPSEATSPYSTKSQMSPITPGLYPKNGFGQFGQQFTQQSPLEGGSAKSQKAKKRYVCNFMDCQKSFFQKTHLDIHLRAHSGDKPYVCKEPGCGQRFSQMGNLKTHQRRHTGEKPFECDKCHKRFAQRGNVRAHKIVHEGVKPFTCRLENCNKQFTQLGNLKSHQNKFHAENIRLLTMKFASITDTAGMSSADKELFEYFADLYKNSNRGIKGRGKDRKIVGSKKPRVDDVVDMHSQDSSMSPGSSVDPGSVRMEHQGNFGYADVDDESSVGSPFEQPHQAQLPPLRQQQPPQHNMHDPYNVKADYPTYTR